MDAARFDFTDRTRTLDIAGREYTFTPGDRDALAAGAALHERLRAIDLKETGAEAYARLCDELTAAIDGVLGEGSTAEILAGRRVNIIDLVDLLAYVLSEAVTSFDAELTSRLADLTETVEED